MQLLQWLRAGILRGSLPQQITWWDRAVRWRDEVCSIHRMASAAQRPLMFSSKVKTSSCMVIFAICILHDFHACILN